jgi:hypothetical protein
MQWVQKEGNGLRHKRTTQNADYILQYEPAAYKALSTPENTYRSAGNTEDQAKKYDAMHHFMLKVRPQTPLNLNDKSLTEFLAYHLDDHVRFVSGRDTLKQTVMYHLESAGSITPYHRILLAYPKMDKELSSLKILINSNRFDQKSLEFTIPQQALSENQSLILKMKQKEYGSPEKK